MDEQGSLNTNQPEASSANGQTLDVRPSTLEEPAAAASASKGTLEAEATTEDKTKSEAAAAASASEGTVEAGATSEDKTKLEAAAAAAAASASEGTLEAGALVQPETSQQDTTESGMSENQDPNMMPEIGEDAQQAASEATENEDTLHGHNQPMVEIPNNFICTCKNCRFERNEIGHYYLIKRPRHV